MYRLLLGTFTYFPSTFYIRYGKLNLRLNTYCVIYAQTLNISRQIFSSVATDFSFFAGMRRMDRKCPIFALLSFKDSLHLVHLSFSQVELSSPLFTGVDPASRAGHRVAAVLCAHHPHEVCYRDLLQCTISELNYFCWCFPTFVKQMSPECCSVPDTVRETETVVEARPTLCCPHWTHSSEDRNINWIFKSVFLNPFSKYSLNIYYVSITV